MSIFLHFHFCPCDAFSSSKFIKRSVLLGAFKSGFLLTTILWSINVRSFNTVWRRTPNLLKICEKHTVEILYWPIVTCSLFRLSPKRISQKNVLQKIWRILSATEWSFSIICWKNLRFANEKNFGVGKFFRVCWWKILGAGNTFDVFLTSKFSAFSLKYTMRPFKNYKLKVKMLIAIQKVNR